MPNGDAQRRLSVKQILRYLENAAWTPLRQWLARPLIDAVPWMRRLRHYAIFLLLIALTSPFSHSYLDIKLSLGELIVHTAVVVVTVALAILLIEAATAALSRMAIREIPISTGGFLLRMAIAYVLSSSAIGLMHAPLPFTRAIMEKHADATQGGVSWQILPFVLLVVYAAYQVTRKDQLAQQLAELQRINRELEAAHRERQRGNEQKNHTPRQTSAVIRVQSKGIEIPLNAESVVRIQADENYCHVVADTGADVAPKRYLVRMTLSEALAGLPDQLFLQTHRSHLVNLRHVAALSRDGRRRELQLSNGDRVPISRSRMGSVQTGIQDFLASPGSGGRV